MSSANLVALLDGPARWSACGVAIAVGDRPVRTWSGLAEAVARRAAGLSGRLGVRPGDAVALFAANCPEYVEIMFSIWHAGAVAVPINARLHPREAAALLQSSRATACFVSEDVAEALARETSGQRLIVPIGAPEDTALRAVDPMPPVSRSLTDDAWIFFTSGTTGKAKGARLSHGSLLAMTAAYYADVSPVSPRDSILHVAALSHASGLFSLPFIGRGASQVLPPSGGFDAGELLELVGLGDRSTFFLPPTLLRRLCGASEIGSATATRIGTVLVGAAPVEPHDLKLAASVLGPRLWNGYGQGETPCTITANGPAAIAAAIEDGDDARLASVGVAALRHSRPRRRSRMTAQLPAGETGEVIVDGPTVMSGYLDMHEETVRGAARRLAAHRRPWSLRRRGQPLAGGPSEGCGDHRRLQRLPARGRAGAARRSRGRRCCCHRGPRSRVGRAGSGVRRRRPPRP